MHFPNIKNIECATLVKQMSCAAKDHRKLFREHKCLIGTVPKTHLIRVYEKKIILETHKRTIKEKHLPHSPGSSKQE